MLLERYNKCIAAGGDYFEGDKSFMCVLSIKVLTRKNSGNLFNDPRIYIYIYMGVYICVLFHSVSIYLSISVLSYVLTYIYIYIYIYIYNIITILVVIKSLFRFV